MENTGTQSKATEVIRANNGKVTLPAFTAQMGTDRMTALQVLKSLMRQYKCNLIVTDEGVIIYDFGPNFRPHHPALAILVMNIVVFFIKVWDVIKARSLFAAWYVTLPNEDLYGMDYYDDKQEKQDNAARKEQDEDAFSWVDRERKKGEALATRVIAGKNKRVFEYPMPDQSFMHTYPPASRLYADIANMKHWIIRKNTRNRRFMNYVNAVGGKVTAMEWAVLFDTDLREAEDAITALYAEYESEVHVSTEGELVFDFSAALGKDFGLPPAPLSHKFTLMRATIDPGLRAGIYFMGLFRLLGALDMFIVLPLLMLLYPASYHGFDLSHLGIIGFFWLVIGFLNEDRIFGSPDDPDDVYGTEFLKWVILAIFIGLPVKYIVDLFWMAQGVPQVLFLISFILALMVFSIMFVDMKRFMIYEIAMFGGIFISALLVSWNVVPPGHGAFIFITMAIMFIGWMIELGAVSPIAFFPLLSQVFTMIRRLKNRNLWFRLALHEHLMHRNTGIPPDPSDAAAFLGKECPFPVPVPSNRGFTRTIADLQGELQAPNDPSKPAFFVFPRVQGQKRALGYIEGEKELQAQAYAPPKPASLWFRYRLYIRRFIVGLAFVVGFGWHHYSKIHYLIAGCNSGYDRACYALAQEYETGKDVRRDLHKALKLYEKSCTAGYGKACNYAGWWLEHGNLGYRDLKKARDLYEQACKKGYSIGCLNAGVVWEDGRGGPKNLGKAFELYLLDCKRNYHANKIKTILEEDNSCSRLKPLLKQDKNLRDRAAVLCNKGNALLCNYLGELAEHGQGGPKDLEKALVFYLKSCDKNNDDGCHHMNALLNHNKRGRDLLRPICNKGNTTISGMACNQLGWRLRNGKGGPKDPKQARIFYKKACDKNYHWGCTNLGWLMEIGEGGPIDVKGAIKLYTKACKLGDPDACKSAKGLSR